MKNVLTRRRKEGDRIPEKYPEVESGRLAQNSTSAWELHLFRVMNQDPLKIRKACPVDWESMTGDDKHRFCDQCQKVVHNVSVMNQSEREALATPEAIQECVYYVENEKGEIADLSFLAAFRRCFPSLRLVSWSALVAFLPITLTGCAGVRCPPPQVTEPPYLQNPPDPDKSPYLGQPSSTEKSP